MIIAGAISIPLALAAGGIASADTDSARSPGAQYTEYTETAGPNGASSHFVQSSVGYDDYGYGYGHYGWNHYHHYGLLGGLLGGVL
ncbi:hypothetical protein [Umezawaea sp. Da 62-37]|uniref:hypothetical protein n=1 Tax=Umezawaea sp. Da 62-37 TaxID=3075927 RepID=UPI0028F72A02|nr:hypothetical protein [Umezawaea sp. Da 62-37]WNV83929.1 hypothetical protein RM788_38060 [Umezawaea sp. Da 62-37]